MGRRWTERRKKIQRRKNENKNYSICKNCVCLRWWIALDFCGSVEQIIRSNACCLIDNIKKKEDIEHWAMWAEKICKQQTYTPGSSFCILFFRCHPSFALPLSLSLSGLIFSFASHSLILLSHFVHFDVYFFSCPQLLTIFTKCKL